METRVSSSGNKEVKIQPDGLPAIWVKLSFCDKCKPYHECLSFKGLSNTEWQEVNSVISNINSSPTFAPLLGCSKPSSRGSVTTTV